jgi:hypothetical protein
MFVEDPMVAAQEEEEEAHSPAEHDAAELSFVGKVTGNHTGSVKSIVDSAEER